MGLPLHVPLLVVSVAPCWGVPETAGGVVFAGFVAPDGAVSTMSWGGEVDSRLVKLAAVELDVTRIRSSCDPGVVTGVTSIELQSPEVSRPDEPTVLEPTGGAFAYVMLVSAQAAEEAGVRTEYPVEWFEVARTPSVAFVIESVTPPRSNRRYERTVGEPSTLRLAERPVFVDGVDEETYASAIGATVCWATTCAGVAPAVIPMAVKAAMLPTMCDRPRFRTVGEPSSPRSRAHQSLLRARVPHLGVSALPRPPDTRSMTADSSIAVVGRWVLVLVGVLAWLVVVPFMALAAELAESRQARRTGRFTPGAQAAAPRGLPQQS